MVNPALKYCIITNDSCNKGNIDLVGFYQWKNVFKGEIFLADEILPNLKDKDFDIIHIRLSTSNIDLVKEVRRKIGRGAHTKIVLSVDVPIETIYTEFPNYKLLKKTLNTADFIFGTEYTIANFCEKICDKVVYEIPYPADIAKLKQYPRAEKKNIVSIIYNGNEYETEHIKEIEKELNCKVRLLLCGKQKREISNSINRNEIEIISCIDENEFCQKLNESLIVIIPALYHNYGKWVIYAAAMGCFVVGSDSLDALRRCFPITSIDVDYPMNYIHKYLWASGNKDILQYLVENAYDKVEYYNYSNLKKKYLDLLFKSTRDKRFNYNLQPKETNEGIVPFYENIKHLYGKRNIKCNKNNFVVLCLVKNGKEYIENYIRYYKKLKAKHFFFIDNGSTDGTVDLLKQYDNVTIYQTDLFHKKYESEIRNTIIEEHCRDRWCLYADIDEFFDYPYSDRISMKQFLKYLNPRKYTAILAYVLDMFPKKVLFKSEREEDLLIEHCYYDISNITKDDYFSHIKAFCCYNKLSDPTMTSYSGGIRKDLFKTTTSSYLLVKHPLMFVNGKVEPVIDPQYCNKAYIADVNGLVRHYKFTTEFKKRVENSGGDYQFFAKDEYQSYLKVLKNKETLEILTPETKKLNNVNELVETNFLKVTDEYIRYAANPYFQNVIYKSNQIRMMLSKYLPKINLFPSKTLNGIPVIK